MFGEDIGYISQRMYGTSLGRRDERPSRFCTPDVDDVVEAALTTWMREGVYHAEDSPYARGATLVVCELSGAKI